MQGFTPSPARLFGVLAVLVCGLLTAHANADGTDRSLTVEKNIQSYVVNADGSLYWMSSSSRASTKSARSSPTPSVR